VTESLFPSCDRVASRSLRNVEHFIRNRDLADATQRLAGGGSWESPPAQKAAPHLVYPPEELLTSQCEGALWHARYPSALFTLCGREAVGSGDGEPTCGVCVTTAVRFGEIDGSVPAHWGWPG
jgi:hypothetical protein